MTNTWFCPCGAAPGGAEPVCPVCGRLRVEAGPPPPRHRPPPPPRAGAGPLLLALAAAVLLAAAFWGERERPWEVMPPLVSRPAGPARTLPPLPPAGVPLAATLRLRHLHLLRGDEDRRWGEVRARVELRLRRAPDGRAEVRLLRLKTDWDDLPALRRLGLSRWLPALAAGRRLALPVSWERLAAFARGPFREGEVRAVSLAAAGRQGWAAYVVRRAAHWRCDWQLFGGLRMDGVAALANLGVAELRAKLTGEVRYWPGAAPWHGTAFRASLHVPFVLRGGAERAPWEAWGELVITIGTRPLRTFRAESGPRSKRSESRPALPDPASHRRHRR